MRMIIALLLCAATALAAEPTTAGKKLIQYGWDSPDTAFLRKHLKEMENSPFEGIMLTVRPSRGEGTLGGMESLGWMMFRAPKFTPQQYEHAVDDLKAAKSAKFTDHFLAVISHPSESGFDWFDDELWGTVLHNIGALAKVAKAGGCAGLMFDPEEYNYPLWSYARQPEPQRKAHTYEQTAEKVRERGHSFVQAINAEFADVKIVTLFGPYIFAQNVQWIGAAKTAEANYNLVGPFYDGICEAATKQTILVDGFEQSYGFKKEEEFESARKTMLEQPRALSKSPDKFAEHVRCGFGIWLDNQSLQKGGWFPNEPAKNHFTSAELQSSVHFALKHSDEYVWVYNERARWWDARPGGGYDEAMIKAKSSPASTQPAQATPPAPPAK
jgi:hypothetical protein